MSSWSMNATFTTEPAILSIALHDPFHSGKVWGQLWAVGVDGHGVLTVHAALKSASDTFEDVLGIVAAYSTFIALDTRW